MADPKSSLSRKILAARIGFHRSGKNFAKVLDRQSARLRRSSLADAKYLIIELGKFFEVGTDDLGLHHQILIDSKLGESLFQSRARRRPAELLGEEFHAAIRR